MYWAFKKEAIINYNYVLGSRKVVYNYAHEYFILW